MQYLSGNLLLNIWIITAVFDKVVDFVLAERLWQTDTVSRLICMVMTQKALFGNSSACISRWVSLEVKCQQA